MKIDKMNFKKIFNKFWQQPEVKQNAINCTKYLIENILHWNDDDIRNNLTVKIFYKNKLRTMLSYIYDVSPYETTDAAYPYKFKPWKLIQTSKNF